LAFKPDIDDLRESPALDIAHGLAQKYANQVILVEPNIDELPKKFVDCQVELSNVELAFEQANVLVMLVDHKEFRSMKPSLKNNQRLFDAKGIW